MHSLFMNGRHPLSAFRAAADVSVPAAAAGESDVSAYSDILSKIRNQNSFMPERVSALYKFYQQMGVLLKEKQGIDIGDAEGIAQFDYALRNPLRVIRQQSTSIIIESFPDSKQGYAIYLALQRQKLDKLELILPYLLMRIPPSVMRSVLPAGEDLSDVCAFAREQGFRRLALLIGPPLPVIIVSPPRPE